MAPILTRRAARVAAMRVIDPVPDTALCLDTPPGPMHGPSRRA